MNKNCSEHLRPHKTDVYFSTDLFGQATSRPVVTPLIVLTPQLFSCDEGQLYLPIRKYSKFKLAVVVRSLILRLPFILNGTVNRTDLDKIQLLDE